MSPVRARGRGARFLARAKIYLIWNGCQGQRLLVALWHTD